MDLSKKTKIKEYMNQKHIKEGNSNGIKIGEVIVNSGIAVEAWKRRNTQIQEEKEEKERGKNMTVLGEQ